MGSPWFRRFGPAPHGDVQLFCFPHAGGAASTYVQLSRRLAPAVDVLAVQYPGRQDRRLEPAIEDIPRLADLITAEILPHTARPYAFFGHSMGAVLAYETARRVQARSAPGPLRTFLSGRSAPDPRPNPHDVMADDTAILAAIRRLGGTGAAVLQDPELVAMIMPALRSDYRALASYAWQPGAPVDTPLTVLVGDADPVVPIEETTGWREHFAGEVELNVFPGGHFYLDDNAGDVAEVVATGLGTVARV
ncbi:alpha/beta fold hydrolase [Streptomyces sp. A3M-1-3]|uniref:thioesterase II family protein n=1 Tax=Streptomyces sp. A3M-1-3 TaxID=2962044 RepID=UPI0020B68599|nr:alpha/beta fold hydrolase [Streptomyces sp. A3M-1-3]MCP3822752.1 alpha/beta fold hydrolase [Streptomyces sp. A3M-1-3]